MTKNRDSLGVTVKAEKEGPAKGRNSKITDETVMYFYHRLLQPGVQIDELTEFIFH